MADPLSVGSLAAAALAIAAEATLKGVVGEAVKDAYQTLKAKVATWASSDVDALEKMPGSSGRKLVVAEAIDGRAVPERAQVEQLAHRLLSEISKTDAPPATGFDIGYLKARAIDLEGMTVVNGIGLRAQTVVTDTLSARHSTIGSPPAKKA